MTFLDGLKHALTSIVGDDDRPLVVFSATWPIMREMRRTDSAAIDEILDVVIEVAAGRTLLMPTFSRGYVDGRCDLDTAPSTTGMLSEAFRRRPGGVRTLSAFFSFKVSGPEEGELKDLVADDAWGGNSLYEWMEKRDARHLLLGTHPTHSSYLHRIEWLARDLVTYRYSKEFQGVLIRDGIEHPATERLYVRCLDPEVKNDFTILVDPLVQAGMQQEMYQGISLAAFDTIAVRDVLEPLVRQDPLILVSNREDFE